MKWYALTHIGAEEALRNELKSLGVAAETGVGACSFEADEQSAIDILFSCQTLTRLMLALDEGEWKSLDLSGAHEHIPEGATFKVETEVMPGGPADWTSTDISAELGANIDRPVDLKRPGFTIFCQAGPIAYCGIDIAGDLSRRYYRIFTNRRSVKGTFAAAMLWLWESEGNLLDPFGNTGEVSIEAALMSTRTSHRLFEKHASVALLDDLRKEWQSSPQDPSFPVSCYDPELGNLRSCKKNAKLAGVDKAITFSKLEPEWMDVKLDESSIDRIVTVPGPVSRNNPSDEHIKELCYQAEFVLGDGGSMVVACLTPETAEALARYAKTYNLSFLDERVVYMGQLPVQVVRYGL